MNVTEIRPSKVWKPQKDPWQRLFCEGRGLSHLHLPLGQIGSELLGCIEDLPLMPQQGHPEILDVSEGESRCCTRISLRHLENQQKTTIGPQ